MQVLTHLTTTLKLSTTAVTFYLTLTLTLNPLYISAAPIKILNRRSISNDPLPLLAKVHTNLTTTTATSQLNKFKEEEKDSEFPLPAPALASPRPTSPSLSIHTPPPPMPITTSNNLEDLTEPVNTLNDYFIANSVKPGDTCVPPKTGEEEKEGGMKVCNGGDVLMRCVGTVWEVDIDCGVAGYGCGAVGVQDFGNGGWKVDVRCLPKVWL